MILSNIENFKFQNFRQKRKFIKKNVKTAYYMSHKTPFNTIEGIETNCLECFTPEGGNMLLVHTKDTSLHYNGNVGNQIWVSDNEPIRFT